MSARCERTGGNPLLELLEWRRFLLSPSRVELLPRPSSLVSRSSLSSRCDARDEPPCASLLDIPPPDPVRGLS